MERILGKLENVEKVETDLETKRVTVFAKEGQTLDKDVLQEKLEKWAKASEKEVAFVSEK